MTSRDLTSFHAHLLSSTRILAVCGAGLSAASGLPTFRGAGGMWRSHNALDLSTPAAFQKDPGMVWQFYSLRRHAALKARPNPAHYALAELSRRKGKQFLTLSQNVDGLSGMAGHPANGIEYLHGSLWNVRCARNWCGYARTDCEDPITEGLRVPKEAEGGEDVGWTDVGREELPGCPDCSGLLRPGVVWFGENLDSQMMKKIEQWLRKGKVDLCIVIGTSGTVYPAAGYASRVKAQGGKVAVVDIDCNLRDEHADWLFEGDAAKVVPEMLEPLIGKITVPEENGGKPQEL